MLGGARTTVEAGRARLLRGRVRADRLARLERARDVQPHAAADHEHAVGAGAVRVDAAAQLSHDGQGRRRQEQAEESAPRRARVDVGVGFVLRRAQVRQPLRARHEHLRARGAQPLGQLEVAHAHVAHRDKQVIHDGIEARVAGADVHLKPSETRPAQTAGALPTLLRSHVVYALTAFD